MSFNFSGYSSLGYKRETNQDFVYVKQYGDKILLAVVADGKGSEPSKLQPGQIAARQIGDTIARIYDNGANEKYIIDNASIIIKEAVMSVNHVIGAFRTANEEIYNGFSCSLTCVLFTRDEDKNYHISFAHVGNTRLYLIRRSKEGNAIIRQLTTDQTEAQKLLEANEITEEQYYLIPQRNKLLCPLGSFSSPTIDTFDGKVSTDCIFLLTTDGIHYAIRPEVIASLILENPSFDDACNTLSDAAISLQYNDDNASIIVRCNND